jgi:hypothetical protein
MPSRWLNISNTEPRLISLSPTPTELTAGAKPANRSLTDGRPAD